LSGKVVNLGALVLPPEVMARLRCGRMKVVVNAEVRKSSTPPKLMFGEGTSYQSVHVSNVTTQKPRSMRVVSGNKVYWSRAEDAILIAR
jgi:hypothetical protein